MLRPTAPTTRTVTPSKTNVPGTDAYEHAQIKKKLDDLQKNINLLRSVVDTLCRGVENSQRAAVKDVQSLGHPYCSNDSTLTNPGNKTSKPCSPFECDLVLGACSVSCRNSSDCVQGYVCDPEVGNGRCVSVR